MVSVPTCRLPVTVIAESFTAAAAAFAHAAVRRNIDRMTERMAADPRPSIATPHDPQARSHPIRLRRRDRDRLCRNLRYCWGVCRNGLRSFSPLPAVRGERRCPSDAVLNLRTPIRRIGYVSEANEGEGASPRFWAPQFCAQRRGPLTPPSPRVRGEGDARRT